MMPGRHFVLSARAGVAVGAELTETIANATKTVAAKLATTERIDMETPLSSAAHKARACWRTGGVHAGPVGGGLTPTFHADDATSCQFWSLLQFVTGAASDAV